MESTIPATHRPSEAWPIAAAMLPFPESANADAQEWDAQLAEVAFEGFTEVDLTDTWVRVGDLTRVRLAELQDFLDHHALLPVAVSAVRRSVLDPVSGLDNLAYSHRTLDAAAHLGCSVVSVGLHQPLTPGQREALWFWTVKGPAMDTSPEAWATAVTRLRELGRHADELGLSLSLEMYEDTLLGSSASALRLLEDIDQPAVGLNPDLGNLFRTHGEIESFQSSVEALLPVSNYWHVKSYYRDTDPTTGAVVTVPAPMRSGSMNYRAAIKTALAVGYSGPFCVEHYGGDGLSVMADNRDYLRRLLAVAMGEATTTTPIASSMGSGVRLS